MTCNQEKRKERKDTGEVKAIKCRKIKLSCVFCVGLRGNKNSDKSYLLCKNLSCFRGDKTHPSGPSVAEYFRP